MIRMPFLYLCLATCHALVAQHKSTSTVVPHNFRSTRLYAQPEHEQQQHHGLAILAMPSTSMDRIANEAILETAIRHVNKLSIILRSDDESSSPPSLSSLRKYVGEVYSALWDCAMGSDTAEASLLDVVVYPQNLPNAAPERWIHHLPDLEYVCSHDSICGWVSDGASGRGNKYSQTDGMGGLDAHVQALNADRLARGLPAVQALHVDPWPNGASAQFQKDNHVFFLDDDDDADVTQKSQTNQDTDDPSSFLGGAVIPTKSLFHSVCVGGTFDGMHYGHRKLLTLAISSVMPGTGKLLIGITEDSMLKHKKHADLIPKLTERIQGVKDFVHRLAPGMKNRIRIVPIQDSYGPPGHGGGDNTNNDFDALVLSHETLNTGHTLNQHRMKNLGLPPLVLLCTRRTEPNGMSSTAIRRLKNLKSSQKENASA